MYKIKPGDGFLTGYGGILQYAINTVQKIRSFDSKAKYSHAGLIVNSDGTTYEARKIIKEYNLADYIGDNVLIYRHVCMNDVTFLKFYDLIKKESCNKIYPFYRMIFHLSTSLAKLAPLNRSVCSETNAKHHYMCEFMNYWKGVTPDNLHDMVCDQWADHWKIIFEGVLTEDIYRNIIS